MALPRHVSGTDPFVINQTVTVTFEGEPQPWVQELLAALGAILAAHGGTVGILRDHAPAPLETLARRRCRGRLHREYACLALPQVTELERTATEAVCSPDYRVEGLGRGTVRGTACLIIPASWVPSVR